MDSDLECYLRSLSHLSAYAQHSAIDVNQPSAAGDLPIHFAAMSGKTEIVRKLIIAGADPDAENRHGWTALDFAIEYDHEELRVLLLLIGAKSSANPFR